LVVLLARVEEKLRVRLHRAANRMEDADPVEVGAAQMGVRVLDAIDGLTAFRTTHRATRTDIPEGVSGPRPTAAGTARPELAGLDPTRLEPSHRARLRHRYRAWERRLLNDARTPIDLRSADGGHPDLPSGTKRELQALFDAWQAVAIEARATLS
jgi:hypothetical protein